MKILFHLVSGQNLPNYIAQKLIIPDRNVFLCTSESQTQFNSLKKLIKDSDKAIIEAWDYIKIQQQIFGLIKKYNNDEILLNFTAGNKIMSTAVFNLFKDLKKSCYYINTEKNEYIHFDFNNNEIKSYPIEIKFELEAVLLLNNQEFEFVDDKLKNEELKIIDVIKKNNHLLDFSNKIANKYQKQNLIKIEDGKFKGSKIIHLKDQYKLIIVYENREVYNYVGNNKKVLDLFFGKWFEYVCYERLKELNYFDELKWGCNIKRKSRAINEIYSDKNEIDIIGNKGPYPYIFECKSGNIKSEAVDKLVAIKESYIGRYATLVFISLYPLNQKALNHKNVLEKINDNKIVHLVFNDFYDKDKIIKIFNQKANLR